MSVDLTVSQMQGITFENSLRIAREALTALDSTQNLSVEKVNQVFAQAMEKLSTALGLPRCARPSAESGSVLDDVRVELLSAYEELKAEQSPLLKGITSSFFRSRVYVRSCTDSELWHLAVKGALKSMNPAKEASPFLSPYSSAIDNSVQRNPVDQEEERRFQVASYQTAVNLASEDSANFCTAKKAKKITTDLCGDIADAILKDLLAEMVGELNQMSSRNAK